MKGFFVVLFVLLLMISSSFTKIPDDLIPINVFSSDTSSNYSVFRGALNSTNATNHLHNLQGIKKIGNYYYIFARESIFVVDEDVKSLDSNEIFYKQMIEWKADDAIVALCKMKGQAQKDCKSYVKLFQEDANKNSNETTQFLACSTNAYHPTCRIYKLLDCGKLQLSEEKVSGNLLCPYNPDVKAISLISDGNLYTATVSGFSNQDALIFRSSRTSSQVNLRTPRDENAVLNEPQFIRFVDPGNSSQKIFVFFKETAVEDQSYKIYSRVGQACKNDQGGKNLLRNQFSSFFKARLNCSLPGQPNFYFDEMNDVTDFVTLNSWYKTGNKTMVFAIMNTPRNSVPASAICAFTLDDIENSLTGPFAEKHSSETSGRAYWEKQNKFPKPHLSRCDRPSSGISDYKLNFVKKHPLMYNSVSAWSFTDTEVSSTKPFFIRTNSKYFLTALTVDTEAGIASNYSVLISGTEDGKILKILLNVNGSILLEERTVFNAEKCTGDKSVRSILLNKSSGFMMVAFENCVIRAPLCPLCKTNCSRNCITSRDPYCGWNGSQCVQINQHLTSKEREKIRQDVLFGNVDSLPTCDNITGGVFKNPDEKQNDQLTTASIGNYEATTVAPPIVINDKSSEEASHVYFVVGFVCLILGVVLGLGFCVLLKKWRAQKETETSEKEILRYKTTNDKQVLDEKQDSYYRSASLNSQQARRSSNPRVSLLVDPKRKRTMTENSYRSDDGLLCYPQEDNSLLDQPNGQNFLHPSRAHQIMSTSSSCADKRRSRYSRPSVNSVGANEEDPSGSAERHPSPLSDSQLEDPFSDEAEVLRHKSLEQTTAPHQYSVSTPVNSVKMRAPPLRSISFQGTQPQVLHRAYSIGNAGSLRMESSRPNVRPTGSRKLSLQIPNAPVNPMYHPPHSVSVAPAPLPNRTFSWINQFQTEQNPPPPANKIIENGKMTDFTHSLDRRRRRKLNYETPFSESFDEHRNPMFPPNAFPARKRFVSESEKVTRTQMSRPPRHQAINEEEEGHMEQAKRHMNAKFLRNHLKLEIPVSNQVIANSNSENGKSPPVVGFCQSPLDKKGRFSEKLLGHSTPLTPMRDICPSELEPPRRFMPQQRGFPETDSHFPNNDATLSFSQSSSPRVDVGPPNFPGREKIRHLSGNYNGMVPSPNRTSAPISLAEINLQKIRNISGGMNMRIPQSPSDKDAAGESYFSVSPNTPPNVPGLIYT